MKSIGSLMLLVSALPLSGCVHPQIIDSYDALRSALKPGDRVEVTASSRLTTGTVERVSADSLAIASDGARREIPRAAIARLEKRERTVRRGALIGLAIGAGAGAAIAGFSDCNGGEILSCGGTRAAGIAGSALVGTGIGAVAGAGLRTTMIYVAQPAVR